MLLHPPLSDPAKSDKISNCHKLLYKSPQEPLLVGGIASAYRQKHKRTGTKSKVSGVFNRLSPKTQQQVETYTRSEQTKSFPQGGKIQNGDTGNHQNIPPTGAVGHINRLQGHLLPHTYTGTIKEISEISFPGSDIQSIAIRPFHSTHGVYCWSKAGETDGHTRGWYLDDWLVRARSHQVCLKRAQDLMKRLLEIGLAGELRKIRTGTEADFQLCRLPVRLQIRLGLTHTGSVAEPTREILKILSLPVCPVREFMSLIDLLSSHRETRSPRSTAYETHTVASKNN